MDDEAKSNVTRFCRIPRILRDGGAEGAVESDLVCSFCGKPLGEAGYLIGSGAARICEACIDTCSTLIRGPHDAQ